METLHNISTPRDQTPVFKPQYTLCVVTIQPPGLVIGIVLWKPRMILTADTDGSRGGDTEGLGAGPLAVSQAGSLGGPLQGEAVVTRVEHYGSHREA